LGYLSVKEIKTSELNPKNLDSIIMKFGTKAIHAGVEPDPSTGAIMTPIFQTSTYVQKSPGDHKGYEYARTQNPTRDALQKNLAALENGKHGLCFSSGMGAIDAVIKLLNPGDEVISTNDLYGGTYRIFTKVFERYGIKFILFPWKILLKSNPISTKTQS
jgi:cystathionine gamma-lyase